MQSRLQTAPSSAALLGIILIGFFLTLPFVQAEPYTKQFQSGQTITLDGGDESYALTLLIVLAPQAQFKVDELVTQFLSKGESVEVPGSGVHEHEVSLLLMQGSQAKLLVNGEVTPFLTEGETIVFENALEITYLLRSPAKAKLAIDNTRTALLTEGQTTTITLNGTQYDVTLLVASSAGYQFLINGLTSVTVPAQEATTVTLGGASRTLRVEDATAPSAKFIINGITTKLLAEGETTILEQPQLYNRYVTVTALSDAGGATVTVDSMQAILPTVGAQQRLLDGTTLSYYQSNPSKVKLLATKLANGVPTEELTASEALGTGATFTFGNGNTATVQSISSDEAQIMIAMSTQPSDEAVVVEPITPPTTAPTTPVTSEQENKDEQELSEEVAPTQQPLLPSSATDELKTEDTSEQALPQSNSKSTTTTDQPLPPACNGCQDGPVCNPYGTRVQEAGTSVYCAQDGSFAMQKQLGQECSVSYECATNNCRSNKCVDLRSKSSETSILKRILVWFDGLF